MKRPILLQVLPDSLKTRFYYRYYQTKHPAWSHLFSDASLSMASGVQMHDLLPGDVISGNIAFTGFYELALSRSICNLARKGGLFVDVGANMGYFSLLWAANSSVGKVIAFEASERNICLLNKNIINNAFQHRIEVVPKAAGNRSGMVSFDLGPSEQTGWGGISSQTSTTTVDVPMVRIDQELADKTIDVLKIDVEGADSWVLFGCENLLKRKRIKTIFFEQNKYRMAKLGIQDSEAIRFLHELDYVCKPFSNNHEEWIAYPKL
jgi:FkbM family methyltransferase